MADGAHAAPDVRIEYTGLFISNEFAPSKTGKTFESINPANGRVICSVAEAGADDVDAAVRAAHEAFQPGSPWRSLDPASRGALFEKLAQLVERDAEQLATLEAIDNGKPQKLSKIVDAGSAAKLLRYHAGWPDKITGTTVPTAGGGLTYTRYEPIGVVAGISPWNFALMGVVSKMAPALAAGNTIVVKPAEQTPLVALHLAALVREAGFPPGVFNVVNGPGESTGAALVAHPLVRKVTFTGSTGEFSQLLHPFEVQLAHGRSHPHRTNLSFML